jgi:hypothetical protein
MQRISDRYGEQRSKRLVINRVGVQIIRQNSQLGSGVGDLDERGPALACPAPGSPSPTLFSECRLWSLVGGWILARFSFLIRSVAHQRWLSPSSA